MGKLKIQRFTLVVPAVVFGLAISLAPAGAQMIDQTKAPNQAGDGIHKSLTDEIGAGRGDWVTANSSSYIIVRDPFRAIRRGRELFQRKFTRAEGQGPVAEDGSGDIGSVLAIGAGLADSCASCHGRPRGSAGTGGNVVTRPDSRDAPHLFGLGLKEMLADEMTMRLRRIRAHAIYDAQRNREATTRTLMAKGIDFGTITAFPDGSVDTSDVHGVDPDLRVRPFFAHGGTISIREFIVGALHAEMGLDVADPDLARASAGGRVVTPAGMVLDGSVDHIDGPPVSNPAFEPNGNVAGAELPTAVVDYLEFYLLNYFPPATYEQNDQTRQGLEEFKAIGCASCHVPDLPLKEDRRVADVETVYDPQHGIFNNLFATAKTLFHAVNDQAGLPPLKLPKAGPFVVKNILTDFKRHDLGPNFYERNWDGTIRKEFLTRPLWGVASKAAYGHDGRSVTLADVILRHGGEGQQARDAFAALGPGDRSALLAFLQSLVLFPPDDTASNLDPGDPTVAMFPQFGHGSIKLTVLFNDPTNKE